jgi:hypothetical protein
LRFYAARITAEDVQCGNVDNYHLNDFGKVGDKIIYALSRKMTLTPEDGVGNEMIAGKNGNPDLKVGEKIDAILYLVEKGHREDIVGHLVDLLDHFAPDADFNELRKRYGRSR